MILGERVTLSAIVESVNFTFSFRYSFSTPLFFLCVKECSAGVFYISFVKNRLFLAVMQHRYRKIAHLSDGNRSACLQCKQKLFLN